MEFSSGGDWGDDFSSSMDGTDDSQVSMAALNIGYPSHLLFLSDPPSEMITYSQEIPQISLSGKVVGQHTVRIRDEHRPPMNGYDLNNPPYFFERWGLNTDFPLILVCEFLSLISRKPTDVVKSRTMSLIQQRYPNLRFNIAADSPGPFLGTTWEGLVNWYASEMSPWMNWAVFLIAQLQGDHSAVPAGSLLNDTVESDLTGNCIRAAEWYGIKQLLPPHVNGSVKREHFVFPGLLPLDGNGNAMSVDSFLDLATNGKEFSRWGIDQQ